MTERRLKVCDYVINLTLTVVSVSSMTLLEHFERMCYTNHSVCTMYCTSYILSSVYSGAY